jgi:hypothetical protein
MSKNPRYNGRPLLRLIEFYVIDSVGELQPADARNLEAMTPKLREVYSTEGDWRDAVSKAMQFPETMPASIRDVWNKNQRIARENGTSLSAEEFAVIFVDANIPQ